MTILTNLIGATVSSSQTTIEGKTLSRPALLYTDGVSVTYGVDVDIGREGVVNENGDIGVLPLYNVPVAQGNRALIYAEIGSAVNLSRGPTGQWQVVGFAKTQPGTMVVHCITLPDFCLRVPTERPPGPPILHPPIIGDSTDLTVLIRPLTYEELGIYGTYGVIPYGAVAKFIGGEFVSLII